VSETDGNTNEISEKRSEIAEWLIEIDETSKE